jgi:hypothetical protein
MAFLSSGQSLLTTTGASSLGFEVLLRMLKAGFGLSLN